MIKTMAALFYMDETGLININIKWNKSKNEKQKTINHKNDKQNKTNTGSNHLTFLICFQQLEANC